MKSEICPLNNELISLNIILKEVESFTQKCELNKRDALRIRLLAEELKGMLPGLVENFEGFFVDVKCKFVEIMIKKILL